MKFHTISSIRNVTWFLFKRHKGLRQYFKEEAAVVNEHMKGIHHTRKDRYMQVAYSSTVEKLCENRQNQPQHRIEGT